MDTHKRLGERRKGEQNFGLGSTTFAVDDALSTMEIDRALRSCKITAQFLVGVFSLDHLPKQYVGSRRVENMQ